MNVDRLTELGETVTVMAEGDYSVYCSDGRYGDHIDAFLHDPWFTGTGGWYYNVVLRIVSTSTTL